MGYYKRLTQQIERHQKSRTQFIRAARVAKRRSHQISGFATTTRISAEYDDDMPQDFTDAVQRRVMRAAIRKAANLVKARQKKIIAPHRSDRTGTDELWTDVAKDRNRKREGLWRSIKAKAFYDKQTGQVIGNVGPGYYDAWIGWFFEVGRWMVHWGRSDQIQEKMTPLPFVKMAGRQTQAQQQQKIKQHVKANWERA